MVKESQNLAALFGPEYKGVFDGVTGDISEAAPPAEIGGRLEWAKKPKNDWSVSLAEAKQYLSKSWNNFVEAVDESKEVQKIMAGGKDFLINPRIFNPKDSKKLRGIRDISTLMLAAASDVVPGLGLWLAGGNLLVSAGTGIAGAVDKRKQIKELRTKDSFSGANQAVLKKLGLTEEDISNTDNSINELLKLSLINDSAIGKIFGLNKNINLKTSEKIIAGVFGASAAVSTLLLSELVRFNIPMPVIKTLASRIMTRFITQQLIPRVAVEIAGLGIDKAKSGDFVDLALSAMSFTFVTLTTGMMAYKGIAAAAAKSHENQPVSTPASPPTETAIPTSTSEEGTLAANLTPTLTVTLQAATATGTPQPTETLPPPMPDWQPGQTVDSNLLQKVFNSGGRYDSIQVNIDNDAEPEQVFRFNLDSDTQPEVWAVKDNQGVWHPWIWEDKGGLYKADLNLDGQIDQGALSYKDLEDNHLLLSWQGAGEERGPLNLEMKDYDLDDDGDNDLLNDADGWYLDRNKNFAFGEGDVRLSEDPVFNSAGNVTKLEAVDGQKWWRGVDGKMIGLVFQDNCWWLDHGGYELDEANPLATTAFTSGGIEVKAANINNFSLESGDSEAFRLVLKDAVIQFHGDKGQWQYDSNGNLVKEGCLLANDQTLAFDRRIEGQGIMAWQYQLALNHPDWTPDEVAKAAFLHQSEPINLNLSRPEPYRAPSGSLTFDQLAMGPRGGDEGIIMHDVHEVNGNLNATQVAQAAHIAVVNNNISGSAMISDVNTTIARFNLESTFGQIMKENGIRDEWVSNYARQAAFTAIKDSIGWQIPGDKIFSGALDNNSLQIFSTHDYSWWEDWLRQNGYIS